VSRVVPDAEGNSGMRSFSGNAGMSVSFAVLKKSIFKWS
jgi:hypothetical protein